MQPASEHTRREEEEEEGGERGVLAEVVVPPPRCRAQEPQMHGAAAWEEGQKGDGFYSLPQCHPLSTACAVHL